MNQLKLSHFYIDPKILYLADLPQKLKQEFLGKVRNEYLPTEVDRYIRNYIEDYAYINNLTLECKEDLIKLFQNSVSFY